MKTKQRYLRFSLARRIEHWALTGSFIALAITGLVQKYIASPISVLVIDGLGGIEQIRIVHRYVAVALMVVSIYHTGTLFYNWLILRGPLTILPTKQDAINALESVKYNLGFSKDRPKQGFYTFEEKVEYWALIWGTLVMIITGFFLWNPITSSKYLPGSLIPFAKSAHGNEALLAVLAIIVWHFYHVLVKHFNTSMYSGFMSRRLMELDHELVLEEEPFVPPAKDDKKFKKRKTYFFIIYGIISILSAGILYLFITVEKTAVDFPERIIERAEVDSYMPLEPTPGPTRVPIGEAADIGRTWVSGIGAFYEDKCGICHRQGGGIAHLDMVTYRGALEGGDSGPAIVPNYPGVSLGVMWHKDDEHSGNISEEERNALKIWILNKAPEY
jgi:cytochrome b subunit of formate dehydrogenase